MYCRNCGYELKESDRKCPACGEPVKMIYVYDDGKEYKTKKFEDMKAPESHYTYETKTDKKAAAGGSYTPSEDSGSVGWWFVGFFLPLVGLILFLVWKDDKPKSSKKAGIGALVGFILQLIIVIVLPILIVWVTMHYYGIDGADISYFGIDL